MAAFDAVRPRSPVAVCSRIPTTDVGRRCVRWDPEDCGGFDGRRLDGRRIFANLTNERHMGSLNFNSNQSAKGF